MRIVITLVIVTTAALLLLGSATITNHVEVNLHSQSYVNGLAKHQLFALLVSLLLGGIFVAINPESRRFLRVGNLLINAQKEKWLGIDGKTSWFKNAWQLLLFISIATGIFMFLGVKQSDSIHNFQWWFIPIALVFALTNSFSEEFIFRFGIIAGLNTYFPKYIIQILSASMFGLPHYFGNPGGFVGIIMAGVLGYILCKATIETKGLSIAWSIHFVQDVIIFIALLMINVDINQ